MTCARSRSGMIASATTWLMRCAPSAPPVTYPGGRAGSSRTGVQDSHRGVDEQVGHVLPRPGAPELAGGNRDVGDSTLRDALGLDAGPRADPDTGVRPLAQEGRDRETRARVTARAPTRDDNVWWSARWRTCQPERLVHRSSSARRQLARLLSR